MITAGAAFSFHRRCIGPTGSAAIPLCNVAYGSFAAKPCLALMHRCPLSSNSDQTGMSALGCRFNRSMQHPLILPDAEVRIWRGMHGRVSCRSRRLSQERQRLDATVFPGEQISSVSLRPT